MKNNNNYANSKQNLVFTTEFCETEKREMITYDYILVFVHCFGFRHISETGFFSLTSKKVLTLIGPLIMYTEQV
jgi:hypothetical protein